MLPAFKAEKDPNETWHFFSHSKCQINYACILCKIFQRLQDNTPLITIYMYLFNLSKWIHINMPIARLMRRPTTSLRVQSVRRDVWHVGLRLYEMRLVLFLCNYELQFPPEVLLSSHLFLYFCLLHPII